MPTEWGLSGPRPFRVSLHGPPPRALKFMAGNGRPSDAPPRGGTGVTYRRPNGAGPGRGRRSGGGRSRTCVLVLRMDNGEPGPPVRARDWPPALRALPLSYPARGSAWGARGRRGSKGCVGHVGRATGASRLGDNRLSLPLDAAVGAGVEPATESDHGRRPALPGTWLLTGLGLLLCQLSYPTGGRREEACGTWELPRGLSRITLGGSAVRQGGLRGSNPDLSFQRGEQSAVRPSGHVSVDRF